MDTSISDLPQPGEKVWYIIKKDSHEGPFSFDELIERKSSGELDDQSPIWAKGWPDSLRFKNVLQAYETKGSTPQEMIRIETINEEASLPNLEEKNSDPVFEEELNKRKWPLYVTVIVGMAVALMAVTQLTPKVELVRLEDMSVAVYRELKKSYSLIQTSVPVPKARVSGDYTKIWMIDRSTQDCLYEASFSSDANSNLSGEMITFKSQTFSAMHWLVFERFTFIEGQRILPGRYSLQLERKNCQSKGIEAFWKKADPQMSLSFDVILYSGAESELTARLNGLAKKKELDEKNKVQASAQYWRDIEEKLRTLSAISSQVEQNFEGLLDRRIAWPKRLKKVIDAYTMKFGGLLTNFIIQNDEDFNRIATQDLIGKIDLMGRQPLINAHAKRIGFISMKFIEKLQSSKEAPNRKDLVEWMKVVTQDFGVERESLRIAVLEAEMFVKQVTQSPAP